MPLSGKEMLFAFICDRMDFFIYIPGQQENIGFMTGDQVLNSMPIKFKGWFRISKLDFIMNVCKNFFLTDKQLHARVITEMGVDDSRHRFGLPSVLISTGR